MKRKLVALDQYHFVFVKDDMSEEEVKNFYKLIYYYMIEHFIEKKDSIETSPIPQTDEKK